MSQEETRIRLSVIGCGGSGKSSVSMRFATNSFVEEIDPTLYDGYQITKTIHGEHVHFDILDTGGQVELQEIENKWIRGADAYVVVYSITNQLSFKDVADQFKQIFRILNVDWVPAVIIGNKCDLEEERQVTTEKGKELAKEYRVPFFETSALTNINIDQAFFEVFGVQQAAKIEELQKKKKKMSIFKVGSKKQLGQQIEELEQRKEIRDLGNEIDSLKAELAKSRVFAPTAPTIDLPPDPFTQDFINHCLEDANENDQEFRILQVIAERTKTPVPARDTTLKQGLKTLFNDVESTADIEFTVEGEEDARLYTHQVVLKARCRYYRGLLSHDWKENTDDSNNKERRQLQTKLNKDVFAALLEYLYTGELTEKLTNTKDLLDLMVAADEYVMTFLKKLCERRLQTQLNKDNSLELCVKAMFYGCGDLFKACLFALAQPDVYPSISETQEFKQLGTIHVIQVQAYNRKLVSVEKRREELEQQIEEAEAKLKALSV
jgi:GTPase KRas protein